MSADTRLTLEFGLDHGKHPNGNEEKREKPRRRAHSDFYRLANAVAVHHAEGHTLRLSAVDDVFEELVRYGFAPEDVGSLVGNVFRGRSWEPMPWRVRRARPGGRARLIRISGLVDARDSQWVPS